MAPERLTLQGKARGWGVGAVAIISQEDTDRIHAAYGETGWRLVSLPHDNGSEDDPVTFVVLRDDEPLSVLFETHSEEVTRHIP